MSSTHRLKIHLAGDGAVGKTSLMITFIEGIYPGEYFPTISDTFSKDIFIDDSKKKKVELIVWDPAGGADFNTIRPLGYPGTDAFLLCFSLIYPATLDNVTKWIEEIRKICPSTPIILVGTMSDLRDSIDNNRSEDFISHYSCVKSISDAEAKKVAKKLELLGISHVHPKNTLMWTWFSKRLQRLG